MEQQDLLSDISDTPFSAKLKEETRTVAIWARAAAILSFISTALACLENISKGSFFSAIIMAAINVTIGVYLYKFGSLTKKGIDNVDQPDLEQGLDSLRLYFKIWTLIVLIVVGLIVVIALLGLIFTGKMFGTY